MVMWKFLNEDFQGAHSFQYDLPRWDGSKWVPSSWVEEKDPIRVLSARIRE